MELWVCSRGTTRLAVYGTVGMQQGNTRLVVYGTGGMQQVTTRLVVYGTVGMQQGYFQASSIWNWGYVAGLLPGQQYMELWVCSRLLPGSIGAAVGMQQVTTRINRCSLYKSFYKYTTVPNQQFSDPLCGVHNLSKLAVRLVRELGLQARICGMRCCLSLSSGMQLARVLLSPDTSSL